jgi:hypothetical protein
VGARREGRHLGPQAQEGTLQLENMLGLYRRKYGVRDVGHVLVALSYFDDADRERMPTMRRPWKWPDIKAAIRRSVRDASS